MYLKIIIFFASTLLLCNCVSTIQSRIDGNPKMFAALTGTQKNAVSKGTILKGMTMDAVYLSWGRPDGIKESNIDGKDIEKWRYSSHMPVWNQNIIYSNHHYYHHDYYGPFYNSTSVGYIPYTSAIVEFENRKVTGWEQER
jgi:hypothetical protein